MSRKYVFTTDNYFKLPVEKLIAGKETTFPLFLYFERNDHLILRYLKGHAFEEADLKKLLKRDIDFFWCPDEYKDAWLKYISQEEESSDRQESRADDQEDESIRSDSEETDETNLGGSGDEDDELTPMEELAVEIMDSDHVSKEQKKEVLSRISSQMVGLLASTTSSDPEEVEEAFNKCREFADAIVGVAAQSHKMSNVYDELKMISEAELSHSTAVSTLSCLFAMGLGFVDDEALTDVALGALLHDVGVIRMDPRLLIIPETSYNQAERAEFEQHVTVGLDIIQKNYIELTDVVQTVIEQHHERFDGKGFPNSLGGIALNELAQVVAIADHVDDLMTGRFDGTKRSPADSLAELAIIRDKSTPEEQPFHPEILASVIQHIEKGKEKAKEGVEQYTTAAIQKQAENAKRSVAA